MAYLGSQQQQRAVVGANGHNEYETSGGGGIAWQVDEDHIDTAGKKMASMKAVTHCYRRNPTDDWPYNLYTMIHAKNEKLCWEIARKLAQKAAVDTYALLFSRKELKKTSMKYFPAENDTRT